jgi:hypothetical protein
MYTGLLICGVVALLVLGLVLLARVDRAGFRSESSSARDASDVTGPSPTGDERPPRVGDAGGSAEGELLRPLALDEPATSPAETPGEGEYALPLTCAR